MKHATWSGALKMRGWLTIFHSGSYCQLRWCQRLCFSPFWITSVRLRGCFLMPGQPSIPILVTQVYAPWRGHFSSINTGGNSYNLIDIRNGCHRLPLMVGEVFAPHQSGTAHVNAGSPQLKGSDPPLPAPMCAWSSDQIDKHTVITVPGKR